MNSNFEQKSIKVLKIDKEYTIKSEDICINFDVDSDVFINIEGLNNLRKISKLNEMKTVCEEYRSIAQPLNITENDSIRWDLILGREHAKKYFSKLQKDIEFSTKLITSYYTSGVYKKRTKVYENLEPVMLKGKQLDVPKYNHCSTTGRTSITSGTNFLTMSKEKRNMLRHKDKNKVLVEIDLKSCEPTFYLKSLGKEINATDVYEDISKKINIEISDRARFKRGILSIMYGARDTTSKNMLRCNFSDLDRIKKYFEIEDFKKSLADSFESDGIVYNYYGRPICYDNSLVNYWIQSSAVDYCSLAFGKLIDDMNLLPCFFVHDSVTVAVDKTRLEEIMSIKSVIDDYSGIEIPIEVCIPSR